MQAAEKLGNEMIQESVSFTRTYDVYIGLNWKYRVSEAGIDEFSKQN